MSGGDVHTADLVLGRDTAAIGTARQWVTSLLAARAVAAQHCEDAVLVASELVTNALRHGEGEIVARLTVRRSELELSVTDRGGELPRIRRGPPSPAGGLGLQIVEHVASRWGVTRHPGGKTVWAILARA